LKFLQPFFIKQKIIHQSLPELLKKEAELETKITTLNSVIKNAEIHINRILGIINELEGIELEGYIHKSDLNSYLTSYLTKD
jgi:hypothetical protein